MNQLLQNRYNELGKEEIHDLKFRVKDSPKILRLINLLESKRDKKLNTVDIVGFLYEGESESFEVLRNRFFKLRKQLLGLLEKGKTEQGSSSIELLPLEEKLYQCRRLIYENHFQLARKELKALLEECRRLNVFELMPETITQLIYCCLAINIINEIEPLTDELIEASALLNDFRLMQALARKTYVVSFAHIPNKIASRLKQMRRLAIRHKDWPRFRLYYHFCVFSYTASTPGRSTKSSTRQLAALRRMVAKYPGMPAGYYEAHAATIMEYYILSGEGGLLFMKGNLQGSYQKLKEAWDIQERIPNLRIRKTENYFSNRIAIEVATGRFREALKTADELIEFQKEQRNEENRLRAYAEIIMIYTFAFPNIPCPNKDFLLRQAKEYISVLRKNNSPVLAQGLATLMLFHFMNGDFKAANKLMADESVRKFYTASGLPVYNKLLVMNTSTPISEVNELDQEFDKLMMKDISPDVHSSLKRGKVYLKVLRDAIAKK